MRTEIFLVLSFSCLLSVSTARAAGDGTFQAPLTILNAGRPGPTTVHAGDLNGDRKLDLITANGSPSILVYFQGAASRLSWTQVPIRVASTVWFVRAGDFTGDGTEDIVASDISSTAFFIRSTGEGTFERPVEVPGSDGARWISIGDWNEDQKLDFATANISSADLTVFVGDGAGRFTLSHRLPGSREHSLEAMDYDGDGHLDMMLGTGLEGITPYRGRGDGTFEGKDNFINLGCVEYIAETLHYRDGRLVLVGDFNKDGKGDLSSTCVETTSAFAGISLGDGKYQKTLETQAGTDVDSTAIADLNRDGNADLAVASKGSTTLQVHLGKGDGAFLDPIPFGATGETPSFLIARDLNGDDFPDVVSADQVSSTLTVFWGKPGERFLESGTLLGGFAAAKAAAVADLDRDGQADLLFPRSDQGTIQVYLKPGLAGAVRPSSSMATEGKYSFLEAVDLDGDAVVDLAGADPVEGTALVAFLDPAGQPRSQLKLPAGVLPASLEVGTLDAGAIPDLAVPCRGSDHVAIFLGQAGGAFAPARILPTVPRPRNAAVGDLDGDGQNDLAVIGDTILVVHYGRGGGDFAAPATVHQDAARAFTDVAIGELNGDASVDLAASDTRAAGVLWFAGRGNREFQAAVTVKVNGTPLTLALADLNGDGLQDLTTANSNSRSVSVLVNQGTQGGFASHAAYGVGVAPAGHRLADINQDGAPDILAFGISSAMVLFGRTGGPPPVHFLRGDVNADGRMNLTDPISVIDRLFLGGAPLPCDDAADADDSGRLNLTDPIAIIDRLFLGGAPLPPPGPECGPDPGDDSLQCGTGCP